MHQSLNYKTPQSVHFNEEPKNIDIIQMPIDMMDKSYDFSTYQQAQQQPL